MVYNRPEIKNGITSLYEAYPPEEALRLAEHLEIHYTPKHGSWLDMAEIETGIMNLQYLGSYHPVKKKWKAMCY